MKSLFTSESVTCGHPDKICDQIADRILDELLVLDPHARVACEVTCNANKVHIFGEITAQKAVDYEALARDVIRSAGYTDPNTGFDAQSVRIDTDLHQQSPDIARGLAPATDPMNSGAGDQGIVFGYACRETGTMMPAPIEWAHALAKRLEQARKSGLLPFLLPDGKTQVTVQYGPDGTPERLDTVLVSAQHRADTDERTVREEILRQVVRPALPENLLDSQTRFLVNPTGRFVLGGPAADSGLTGRKIICDTYGGYGRHGGGAFSGKDATKVDRSGAYMARYLAKNIVAAGYAQACEVQLGYAIGVAEPVSVRIDAFGTQTVPLDRLYDAVLRQADLRPMAIIRRFGLTRPIYSPLSCYGHFGQNAAAMPWEQTDLHLSV